MPTPSIEDYLERIYELIQEKGYARVVDLSERLDVQASSVTKMIQKLDEQEFVKYEKYRGLVLTHKGQTVAQAVKNRHTKIEELLRMLGIEEQVIQRDVEGIEHHLSPSTLSCLRDLVSFFNEHPEMLRALQSHRAAGKTGS